MFVVSHSWDEKEAGLDAVLEPPEGANVLKSFKVYVKTLTGKTITLEDVNASTTIAEVKKHLQDNNIGSPPCQQRIIFAGRELKDNHTLFSYGVKNECELHMLHRLRGGMFHPSSGRSGFDLLRDVQKFVTIKYGDGSDEQFKLQLNNGETRESLLERANAKVSEINALQEEIDAIKSGAESEQKLPAKKKQKTTDDADEDEEESNDQN